MSQLGPLDIVIGVLLFIVIVIGLAILGAPRRNAAPTVPEAPPPERGTAAFYGDEYVGRPMANGEPYRHGLAVCAHRTHPFGTVLTVVNLANGRSAACVVSDRGPFVAGRVVDISRGSADLLGFGEDGIAEVEVRVMPGVRLRETR